MKVKTDLGDSTADDLGIVGRGNFSFYRKDLWSMYALADFDRYCVSKVASTLEDGKQSFIYKNSVGLGVEKKWEIPLATRFEFAYVLPTTSVTNNLRSGLELGLGAEYNWRKYFVGYKYSYLSLSMAKGNDNGSFQQLRFGYNF